MLNQVQHDEDERLRWVSGSDRRQPGARNGGPETGAQRPWWSWAPDAAGDAVFAAPACGDL